MCAEYQISDRYLGDSMERYPERAFILVPGQPKFDFNTCSISPLYETRTL